MFSRVLSIGDCSLTCIAWLVNTELYRPAIRFPTDWLQTPSRLLYQMCGLEHNGGKEIFNLIWSHRACQNVLSVKTHRRVATGNTKSREVAGALAGTAPSVNGPQSGTRLCFESRGACHLTYTWSGRCETCFSDLPACTDICKHKSEPWSAPQDDSCIGCKEPIESRCRIRSVYLDIDR